MDTRIIDVLQTIKDSYGDMIFYNHQKTRNLMHDLAPGMHKERIQVGQFLEMNGYFQLKYAGHSYRVVRERLIQNYISTYGVHENIANWIVDVFCVLLDYSDFSSAGDLYKKSSALDLGKPSVAKSASEVGDAALGVPGHTIKPRDARETTPRHTVNHGTPRAASPTKQRFSTAPYENTIHLPAEISVDPHPWRKISADMHSVAVTPEGRVRAAGLNSDGQCNVGNWRNIRAVSAGAGFTVGLRENGTVTACGRNEYGQCNVRKWTDIVAISAGARHTLGLKADGTVVAAGQNLRGECNVASWRNIIYVSAGYRCSFGIKKDNRVLVKGDVKNANLSVSHLNSIVDIANPAPFKALALRRDGRLQRVGKENTMGRTFHKWRGIEQISAGPDYFAGLRRDGTVALLAYFWMDSGIECNFDDWTDIAAIAAGRFHLLGLKRDGTLVAEMLHPSAKMDKGQCKVEDWRVF